MPDIQGLRVLVTASTSGMGFGTAMSLLAAGGQVVVNGRDPARVRAAERLLRSTSEEVRGVVADVSDDEGAELLIAACRESFGGLDSLVIFTGRPPAVREVTEPVAPDLWEKSFKTQLIPVVKLIEAARSHLVRSRHPSVVAVTSSTVKDPMPRHLLSTVPRTSMTAYVQALARSPAWRGVRMNCVAPVSIATEGFVSRRSEEQLAQRSKETPLGRLGTSSEFANTVKFCVHPDSSFVNGQTIFVDGGYRQSLI